MIRKVSQVDEDAQVSRCYNQQGAETFPFNPRRVTITPHRKTSRAPQISFRTGASIGCRFLALKRCASRSKVPTRLHLPSHMHGALMALCNTSVICARLSAKKIANVMPFDCDVSQTQTLVRGDCDSMKWRLAARAQTYGPSRMKALSSPVLKTRYLSVATQEQS
ncbi:hypothetical protein B0H12DRAFT_522959 [Mycena haematopus]|nr:hypothetical protein B0H12DRAFT_522959 [Mycena haematopus]